MGFKYTEYEFYKAASCNIDLDELPTHVSRAAYNIYSSLPEKCASLVLESYSKTENELAKLAFEVIGAALIKEAEEKTAFLPAVAAVAGRLGVGMAARGAASTVATTAASTGAKSMLGGVAKNVGINAAFAAPAMFSSATENSSSTQQGMSHAGGIEQKPGVID